MKIPESYPANFPDCKFRHDFKHYHIYQSGAICLPLLKTGGWNATKTLI
jgi:ubiquitin-protein ligase